jgi:hypothetical protein
MHPQKPAGGKERGQDASRKQSASVHLSEKAKELAHSSAKQLKPADQTKEFLINNNQTS